MNFLEESKREIFSNLFNDYNDNWDYIRFGKNKSVHKPTIRGSIQKILNRRGYYHMTTMQPLITNSLQVNKFEFLYNNLESDEDKKLLLKVLAYRILGYRKVKLPLNTADYWNKLKSLEELIDKSDFINPNFLHFSLYRMNLKKINYPVELYFTPSGILADFIVKQYEYHRNDLIIKAERGDYVIDGGGCWGDTALYFANEVGRDGMVFSFEFIPNNIKIFERNLSLNDQLKETIELVNKPLWMESGTKIYFNDNGPGSEVSIVRSNDLDGECDTLSIDDMVKQKQIKRIDFIKMDIEGAETNALKGATETIIKYRPKLAIALYHNAVDFERIPLYLKKIVPEYQFYFSHCSIHEEESILFAKVNR